MSKRGGFPGMGGFGGMNLNQLMKEAKKMQSDVEKEVKLNIPQGLSAQNGENSIKVKFKVLKEENITKNLVCNVQYSNLNTAFSLDSSNPTVNVLSPLNVAAT